GFQPIGPGGELVDTGLPGEPNIDKTDIEEGDIIGLTSFFFFAPFNVIKLFNDGNLWNALRPGFFDVGQQNKDGDFIYGTGYFPLQAGQTERISLAFFFGNNREEIFRTKNTVQLIYNNDYNFAKSPRLPGVRAFAGDGEVTLYWDTIAEQSFDRLSQEVTGDPFDFEGYKIYRATFPSWDETGVVRNVFGTRIADVPIAQFDVVDSDSGFFPAIDPELGSVFYLGDNTGLVHTYKDTTVQNGFTYFYAVTAYDHGIFFTNDSTGEQQILQPAETSKFATINQAGEIEAAKNVIVVKPEAPAAGHIPAEVENLEQVEGDGNGEIFVQIVDPLRLKDGHEYELTFEDEGFTRSTKNFTVVDITGGAQDTIINKDPNVDIDAVTFDGTQLHIMNAGRKIGNRWQPLPVPATHLRWSDTTRSIVQPENWNKFQASLTQGTLYPANYRLEVDEMGVDSSAGIPLFGVPPVTTGPVNFRIKNVSEDRYVTFNLYDLPDDEPAASRGKVDESDLIAIFETHDDVVNKLTYSLKFRADSTAEAPQSGDVLELPVNKPFLNYDVFQFKVKEAKEDRSLAQNQLNDIKVVPNPYIATATWEPRNNFSDGRGPREIHFTHLPKECTIRIYNLRGELVDTIDHNSHVTNGTATWDMLTRDQLDISYGVYIYHVDAPGIGEKIGKFAVIK
ncbi:MAG: hypothetical protein GWN00_15840, partial [Aliifodinibius sp.]|nr:hypothetical protein [Fodinibius sp.]NIV12520.1 hypothetical protein [Fodinibius sp.]NIY26221.1 hypothetical protein [Fodinibius sp.]